MQNVNFNLAEEALRELAQKDIQEQLWTSDRDRVSSFIEAVESLFDDSGLGFALERSPDAFTAETLHLLRRLQAEIRLIDPYMPPERLINYRRMNEVRRTARNLLQLRRHWMSE